MHSMVDTNVLWMVLLIIREINVIFLESMHLLDFFCNIFVEFIANISYLLRLNLKNFCEWVGQYCVPLIRPADNARTKTSCKPLI